MPSYRAEARYATDTGGLPVWAKMPTARVDQGVPSTVAFDIRQDGVAVDLGADNADGSPFFSGAYFPAGFGFDVGSLAVDPVDPVVVVRIAEALSDPASALVIQAEVVDAASGACRVRLTPEAVARPGIYIAEAAELSAPGVPRRVSRFYLAVDRGVGGDGGCGGPPSLAEIRLHLRDNAAEDNLLLDRVAWDDSEIAACLARPVMYWNETLPPSPPHTTASFPHRFHWLEGAVACMFFLAAEWYRRNHLAYQAGGTSVDDNNRADAYDAAGDRRWKAYQQWAQARKVAETVGAAVGTAHSPYGRTLYRRWW